MQKAFAYLRVSGKGQVEGDGLSRQLLACQAYATVHGYEIVGVFQEEGIGGKTELANRPALSEMLSQMEDRGISVILIEKLDRMARDLMVSETILADLRKSGYTLLSTCEPDLCSEDPSRKLVRQIFSAIAEYDRAMIVLKLRGARQRLRSRNGKCEGRKSFGEKPGEIETLNLIRAWSAERKNSEEIAMYLNGLNKPTRTGKGEWRASVIAKILARGKKQSQAPELS